MRCFFILQPILMLLSLIFYLENLSNTDINPSRGFFSKFGMAIAKSIIRIEDDDRLKSDCSVDKYLTAIPVRERCGALSSELDKRKHCSSPIRCGGSRLKMNSTIVLKDLKSDENGYVHVGLSGSSGNIAEPIVGAGPDRHLRSWATGSWPISSGESDMRIEAVLVANRNRWR